MANPNIERVSFEEIQEFKNLDLHALPTAVAPDNLVMLIYDTNTRLFTHANIDTIADGDVNISTDALLETDITVNTDDLPVNRGHVFLQGTSFTDVINTLCNPPTDSSLAVTISETVIEWGVSTSRETAHVFTQGTETDGEDAGTIVYYKDNVVQGSAIDISAVNIEGDVLYEVALDTLTNTLPLKAFRSGAIMRVIFPVFIGNGASASANGVLLKDIKKDGFIICDFPGLAAGFDHYWFAVEENNIPIHWAEIDAQGNETAINKGELSLLFEYTETFMHNGNNFFAYRTLNQKTLPLRIKIYF
jgi:hypothetical protein